MSLSGVECRTTSSSTSLAENPIVWLSLKIVSILELLPVVWNQANSMLANLIAGRPSMDLFKDVS